MEYLTAKDIDGTNAFAAAMIKDDFDRAIYALNKVPKEERGGLLDSVEFDEEDEENEYLKERIAEWRDSKLY